MAYDHKEVWERHFGNKVRAKDICGAEMDKSAHGDTCSEYGWQVDHIIPESRVASGDPDHPDNLRPLHWKNNEAKGNALDEERWMCARTSPGWFGL